MAPVLLSLPNLNTSLTNTTNPNNPFIHFTKSQPYHHASSSSFIHYPTTRLSRLPQTPWSLIHTISTSAITSLLVSPSPSTSKFVTSPSATLQTSPFSFHSVSSQVRQDILVLLIASVFLIFSVAFVRTMPIDRRILRSRPRWSLRPPPTLPPITDPSTLQLHPYNIAIPYGATVLRASPQSTATMLSPTISLQGNTLHPTTDIQAAGIHHPYLNAMSVTPTEFRHPNSHNVAEQQEMLSSMRAIGEMPDSLQWHDEQNQYEIKSDGLSEATILNYPTYICSNDTHETSTDSLMGSQDSRSHPSHWSTKKCVICQDSFKSGDVIRILPCTDEFHADCVHPWLISHSTCPQCRTHFT